MAADSSGNPAVHGGLFALFAFELFCLGLVAWSWIVNRHSFPGQFGNVDWVPGLLSLAAAAWSGWYLKLSWQATRRGESDYSRNLLAIAVVSGAALLGILSLGIAREFVSSPLVIDARPQFAVTKVDKSTVASAVATGNAADGGKLFAMTCATCHGPTGEGVANAAPALRGSEFLKSADQLAIMSLIRLGRAATDPANKSGKPMPARGGNPFLDDKKIADLAAFVKQIDTQLAGETASGRAVVSTDFSSLQTQLASQPAPVINQWTLSDFEGFQIPEGEQAFRLGMNGFVNANCNKCHLAEVEGQELGPALDQIVKKYKRDDLLSHIIEPSREINEKFQSDTVLLLDGRTVTGFVVSETEEQIAMLTDLLKPEQVTTILLDEIEDRVKSKLSPMPAGLADVLTKEEIGGLVAYIDAVGRKLGAGPAVVLNRWVVPAAAAIDSPTTISVSKPVEAKPWSATVNADSAARYRISFSWLFVTATSVLALHILWLTGTGAAVVLHRELQLSSGALRFLSQQTILFWSIGLFWILVWFVLFFLWG